MKKNKKTIRFILLLLLITITYIFWKNDESVSTEETKKQTISLRTDPSPTPFPFQELTVPFLRQKQYESKFGEMTLAYENENYFAYLTSYLSDGFKINGLLTKPKSLKTSEKYPAIVFIHGFIPPRQYNTVKNYYDYVDYLAGRGFMVFKSDLRGNASSEGEAGGAYYSESYIVDVLNAYSALQNSDFVNPARIGLWGHSMAGNVVMRSLAVKPDIPAAVIWAGAVYTYQDMSEFGISDSSYTPPGTSSQRARRRQQIRELYGEPDSGHIFWQQLVPTNFLPEIKSAIQIHHAADDPVVNIGYSRNLVSLLKEANKNYDFREYQSGGHNISSNSFTEAMESTVEFFNNNLK